MIVPKIPHPLSGFFFQYFLHPITKQKYHAWKVHCSKYS